VLAVQRDAQPDPSPGYGPAWRVQFPKDIRTPGARYLVTELHAASRGGFYRARGEIRRLG